MVCSARAERLREWARAVDGSRLHRMLGEIASPRAAVALAALDGAEQLLRDLPAAEARIRSQRELAALEPLAVDAPQLAALAALQLTLGRKDEALASSRAAAARNPRSAPAAWLAARLETEPALQQIALQTLRAQARDLAATHENATRTGDPSALAESCAALRAATRAAESIPEAKPEALAIQRQLEEGLRNPNQNENQNENQNQNENESPNQNENPNPSSTPLTTSTTSPKTRTSTRTRTAFTCTPPVPAFSDARLRAAHLLISSGTALARPALSRAPHEIRTRASAAPSTPPRR